MFYKPVDFGLLGKVPENHMQPVAFFFEAGKDYWDKRYQAWSIREPVGGQVLCSKGRKVKLAKETQPLQDGAPPVISGFINHYNPY